MHSSVKTSSKAFIRKSFQSSLEQKLNLIKPLSPTPKGKSFRKLWQDRKYWAKNDDIYLSEIESNNKEASKDVFKQEYIPKLRKMMVSEDPQKSTAIPIQKITSPKKYEPKWTTEEDKVRGRKYGTRSYEEYPIVDPSSTDFNLMYSSFSGDLKYQPEEFHSNNLPPEI
jgi:hypothetical protein